MDKPLSFYELMRGLKALKQEDLVRFGSVYEGNTQVPKEKIKRASVRRMYTVLSRQCRYEFITLQNVASTLKEIGREAQAKAIEQRFSSYQEHAPSVIALQRKFGKLIQLCSRYLLENEKTVKLERVKNVAIEEFAPQQSCELNAILDRNEDVDELFITLTVHGLWDYQNCDFLAQVTEKLAPALSIQIQDYKKRLQLCPLSEVVCNLDEIIPHAPELNFAKFTVEMKPSISMKEQCVSYVSSLSASIAQHLGLKMAVFLLKTITNEPFKLTWFFPKDAESEIEHLICNKKWYGTMDILNATIDHCDGYSFKRGSSTEMSLPSDSSEDFVLVEDHYMDQTQSTQSRNIFIEKKWPLLKATFQNLKNDVVHKIETLTVQVEPFRESLCKLFPEDFQEKLRILVKNMTTPLTVIFHVICELQLITEFNYHILEECAKEYLPTSHNLFETIKGYKKTLDDVGEMLLADFIKVTYQPKETKKCASSQISMTEVTFLFEEQKECENLKVCYVAKKTEQILSKFAIYRHVLLFNDVYYTSTTVSIVYNIPLECVVSFSRHRMSLSVKEWCEENKLIIKIKQESGIIPGTTCTTDFHHGFTRRHLKTKDGKNLPPSIPLISTKPMKYYSTECKVTKCDEESEIDVLLETNPTAIELIRGIDKTIAVMGICGPYRGGKSYFMSQTLGFPSAFDVGHYTEPCTQGIVMATSILECDDYAIIFLDMEGTDDAVKNSTPIKKMNGLLVMMTLLCSYLIYNSSNIPKRGDVEAIRTFSQLAASILSKDIKHCSSPLPMLLWLLRDVRLELPEKEGGGTMTATEYIKEKILCRENDCDTIMEIFPAVTAAFLPPPSGNPQEYSKSESDNDFNEKVHNQIENILTLIKPKNGLNGRTLTGPLFANLIVKYEERISVPGAIPDVERDWYSAVFSHLHEGIEQTVEKYTKQMQEYAESKFPFEVGNMDDADECTLFGCHNSALTECLQDLDENLSTLVFSFSSPKVETEKNKLHQKLKDRCGCYDPSDKKYSGELKHFYGQNFESSKATCKNIFHELHVNMHCVDKESLKKKFTQRAATKGPAKHFVLETELKLVPGPPADITVINNYPRYVIIGWNKPEQLLNAAMEYKIMVKGIKMEWKPVQQYTVNDNRYDQYTKLPDLTPNSKYGFYIRGRKGESSPEIYFQTPPDVPDPPSVPNYEIKGPCEVNISVSPLENGCENGSPVNAVIIKWCFEVNNSKTEWRTVTKPVDKKNSSISHDITIKSFDEEGEYHFAAQFKNDVGYSKESQSCSIATADLIPGEPTDVEVHPGVKHLEFTWKPPKIHPKCVKRYDLKIKRKGSVDTDWKRIENDNAYSISSLQPYTEYEYAICAVSKSEGVWMRRTTWTDAGCPDNPSRPTLNVSTSERVIVTIHRLKPEQENGKSVTAVCIEKSIDKQKWLECKDASVELTLQKEVRFCEKDNDDIKTYSFFRVKMKNEMGFSEPSMEAEIPIAKLIPSAPKNLKVVTEMSGPTKMTLQWETPMYHLETVREYCIEVRGDEADKFHMYKCQYPSFTISELLPDTDYRVTIMAKTIHDKLGEGSCELVYRTPFAPPSTPTRDQVFIDVKSEKSIMWDITIPPLPSGQKKILFVKVEKSALGTNDWEVDSENKIDYPDAGGPVNFKTNYKKYMRLCYISDVGKSEYSDVVTVPDTQLIPGVPLNFVCTSVTSSSISVQWDKPQANRDAVKKYRLEVKYKHETWGKLLSVKSPKLNCVIEKLDSYTPIPLRICAKNGEKGGDWCELEPVVTTLPAKPSVLKLKMLTYNSVSLRLVAKELQHMDTVCLQTQESGREYVDTYIKCEDFESHKEYDHYSFFTHEFHGTPIHWRIKLCSGRLEGEFRDPLKTENKDFITKPVTGVKVKTELTTQTSCTIVWDKPNELSERIEMYEVIIYNKDGTFITHPVQKDMHTYQIDDLSSGTKYRIAVNATNSYKRPENEQGKGNEIGIEVETKPTKGPKSLKMAGATNTLIQMKWEAPETDPSLFQYNIYYKSKKDKDYNFYGTVPKSECSAKVDELENCTCYDFKVVSVNSNDIEGDFATLENAWTKRSDGERRAMKVIAGIQTLGVGAFAANHALKDDVEDLDDVKDDVEDLDDVKDDVEDLDDVKDDVEDLGESQKSSLLQHLQEQLTNKNMIFTKHQIQLSNTVGQGESGLVYKAYINTAIGKELVAVKTGKALFSTNDLKRLAKEVSTMLSFEHTNVMSLIGVCIDGEMPLLIMPFMSNGSVLDFIKRRKVEFLLTRKATQQEIQVAGNVLLGMCHQITKGMEYLSEHNFVHRDLAARNCMIDGNRVIKVADFGLTEDMYGTNYFRRRESVTGSDEKVPIRWMAPESIENDIYTEATDVWSFGVTVWEIYTCGRIPYSGIHPMGLLRKLQAGHRLDKPDNEACHDGIYDIMLSCWNIEGADRPRFSSLVNTLSDLLERDSGYLQLSSENGCGQLELLQEEKKNGPAFQEQEMVDEPEPEIKEENDTAC